MNNNKLIFPMYKWAQDLFPIARSITGPGVRQTLKYLQNINPELKIKSVKTGEKFFDWEVPSEWFPADAWIKNNKGKKIIDFKKNNLHLVGYSKSIKKKLKLKDLNKHLHSLSDQPNAIPYVTSYYKKDWGFCLTENQRKKLKDESYQVHIDTSFKRGVLNYGEIIIKGKSKKEIFLTTYICHPSMANNEISGPVVLTALVNWIKQNTKRNFTYRIIFIPETIGSIVYISKNLKKLKKDVIAAFNITCVGDNNCYSYVPSRHGNTFTDKVSLNILKSTDPNFKKYSWLDRGSDERQFCSPGVDLPMVTLCRSKFGEYKEYHTSLDNLNFISQKGLQTSYELILRIIQSIELNKKPKNKFLCEPHLSSRNMYPTLSVKNNYKMSQKILDIISFCDGQHDIFDISNKTNLEYQQVSNYIEILIKHKVLKS